MSEPLMQPWLHDRSILVSAPAQVWADSDGTIGTRAIDGIFFGDRRVFSGYRFELGDVEPAHVATERVDSATTRIVALARQFSGPTADPRVLVERRRTLTPGRLTETIRVANALPTPVETTLRVALVAADDDMQAVKGGEPSVPVDIVASEHAWSAVGATGTRATVSADGARGDAQGPVLSLMWDIRIPANELVTVSWRLDLGGTSLVDAAQSDAEWADVQVRTGDPRVGRWLERSLSDLEKLRMVVRTDHADQEFLAAGAPWYFTLFGRDSLWAARFMLPLGTRLAEGTLSTLAERQGTRTVPETAEQPGKILHELRAATVNDATGNTVLPPLYYGTIDATCLWISLLAEAWDWGMPEDSIRTLLPNLEAALRWMDEFGDADGDGFLEYQDVTGHGLANQGWKDSSDSVQWNDGTLAQGPIALCEVQGYAYKAALDGARLLEHFGRPGAQHWRQWAAELKERFNAAFWTEDDRGSYPGIALDVHKRLVDSATSNMGHLLGTGILTPEGAARVVGRLCSDELSSGFGIRTLSSRASGYWPLSYHGGSIWPHDTAIAIWGMTKEGFHAEAAALAEGLVSAAECFDYTIPELYSGESRDVAGVPTPYPAACRPQAWSAASAVVVVSTLLGLTPADRSSVRLSPDGGVLGRGISLSGIRVGDARYRVVDSLAVEPEVG